MTTPQPSYRTIPLTGGYEALVDEVDYERVAAVTWYAVETYRKDGSVRAVYAISKRRSPDLGIHERMHRFILGAPPGTDIDHKDHNGLHNWRDNLRECNSRKNQWNRRAQKNETGFKGVRLRVSGTYTARITIMGKRVTLGTHATAESAARAYDAVAAQYFGEFACLNFPKPLGRVPSPSE
jgi:hypothetical protein